MHQARIASGRDAATLRAMPADLVRVDFGVSEIVGDPGMRFGEAGNAHRRQAANELRLIVRRIRRDQTDGLYRAGMYQLSSASVGVVASTPVSSLIVRQRSRSFSTPIFAPLLPAHKITSGSTSAMRRAAASIAAKS